MKRAILLTGFFTDEEMRQLLATIRAIESNHRDVLYQVNMVPREWADQSVGSNIERLKEMFPIDPKNPPQFYTKRDGGAEWLVDKPREE